MLKTSILLLISMTFLGCQNKPSQPPMVCEDFGVRKALTDYTVYKEDIVDYEMGYVFSRESCKLLEE